MDILLDEKIVWNMRRIVGLQIDVQKHFWTRNKSNPNLEPFVTKLIEPYEIHFCFYLRLNHEEIKRDLKYNFLPVGLSTNIEKALAIMCNNLEWTGTKKKKIASKDFCISKVYSKLKCSNKVVPITDSILFQNWTKRLSYKSIKATSANWLVIYDFLNETYEESNTLSPLCHR